eukprot:6187601-Ditylum_brightwellii.AAC.1
MMTILTPLVGTSWKTLNRRIRTNCFEAVCDDWLGDSGGKTETRLATLLASTGTIPHYLLPTTCCLAPLKGSSTRLLCKSLTECQIKFHIDAWAKDPPKAGYYLCLLTQSREKIMKILGRIY